MKPTVECSCQQCGGHMEFASEMIGHTVTCPYCYAKMVLQGPNYLTPLGAPTAPTEKKSTAANIKTRTSLLGTGCALQGLSFVLGLLALGACYYALWLSEVDHRVILILIGSLIFAGLAFWLFFYGGAKARWNECSLCGGKIAHARVAVCPHCHANFAAATGGKDAH